MTALANLTRTTASIAVTAMLAVVLIATIASCGGSGVSSATGFHDPKLLTASIAYQGAQIAEHSTAKVGGSPYGARCHQDNTPPVTMNCTYKGYPASCPIIVAGNATVCQFSDEKGRANLRVTLTSDGSSYTATAGYVPLSDHIGG